MEWTRMHALLLLATLLWPSWVAAGSGTQKTEGDVQSWGCQWVDMCVRVRSRVVLAKRVYVLHLRELQQGHEKYVAALAEDSGVRNYKSVREARVAAAAAVRHVYDSSERMARAMSHIYNSLGWWMGQFQVQHKLNRSTCNLQPSVASPAQTAGFGQQVSDLRTDMESLLRFSAAHIAGFNGLYADRLRQAVQAMAKEEAFFTLKENALESFRSVVNAQASAKDLKRVLDDRMEVGCEVERRLGVLKEIFLALKHVAADVVRREEVLLERLAALESAGFGLGSMVAVTNTKDAHRAAEEAGDDANAAYKDIMVSIQGEDAATFHAELGEVGEFEIAGEKCVDDIREERMLLREATRQGQYNFHGFVNWKAVVESLWSKVKRADNIVPSNCYQWKGVRCAELAAHIRHVMDSSDVRRANVEERLTRAIRSLVEVETSVHAAEVRAASAAAAAHKVTPTTETATDAAGEGVTGTPPTGGAATGGGTDPTKGDAGDLGEFGLEGTEYSKGGGGSVDGSSGDARRGGCGRG
ncbi:hypothetical protein ERJ75_000182400 [Trypanosoma vivax]|nr:hypothetical protein ERJ75_000182400 [Trypanosoma vivax]